MDISTEVFNTLNDNISFNVVLKLASNIIILNIYKDDDIEMSKEFTDLKVFCNALLDFWGEIDDNENIYLSKIQDALTTLKNFTEMDIPVDSGDSLYD